MLADNPYSLLSVNLGRSGLLWAGVRIIWVYCYLMWVWSIYSVK